MIAVRVRDEDEVRLRQSLIGGFVGAVIVRVDVDAFAIPAEERGRVVQRMNDHVTFARGNVITRDQIGDAQLLGAIVARGEVRRSRVRVQQRNVGSGQRNERRPLSGIRRGIDPIAASGGSVELEADFLVGQRTDLDELRRRLRRETRRQGREHDKPEGGLEKTAKARGHRLC